MNVILLILAILLSILCLWYWWIFVYGLIKYRKVGLSNAFWLLIGNMGLDFAVMSSVAIMMWLAYFGVFI